MNDDRQTLLADVDEAVRSGARQRCACELLGLNERTLQRWRIQPDGDQRQGPHSAPPNKLSDDERARVLDLANSEAYRDLSPKQIVPLLADRGIYVASESTFYRVLRSSGQLTHRSACRPVQHTAPPTLRATGPNQVYSWDITYLKSPIKGAFYYLYLFVDIWSRKVVGWRVEDHESSELAAQLAVSICESQGVAPGQVRLHSDNGGPMKGATMLATLQQLGIVPSFSRPSVSNDNPFSESLFRTVKYRPNYPRRPFESIEEARTWTNDFVLWYNAEHLHSALNFVTPDSRHCGQDKAILRRRVAVYEAARQRHPRRWATTCRNWSPTGDVVLNGRTTPIAGQEQEQEQEQQAA